MTYQTLLDSEEAIKKNYLMILRPRRRITGTYTLSTPPFVYSTPYDLGDIDSIEENGVTMTEVPGDTTPSAGEWSYDSTTETLYLRTFQSADPDTVQIVVTYKIYAATFDAYWYSDPLDDTTTTVYWEPVIKKSPDIQSSTSDSLFGALPVLSSSITLLNADHIFERHVSESSFYKASIKIYHWLGELTVANLKLVYDGLMDQVTYSTDEVSIKTLDRIDELSSEYRNETGASSFYSTSLFANVDPNFIGKPIRYVWGYVKGFLPVNVDYDNSSPTTNDNRDWSVMAEQSGISETVRTVTAGSTATQTNLSFAEGLTVGDRVHMDRVVGVDEYKEILTVSYSPAFITHSALTGGAMAASDSVRKGFVSAVDVIQNNVSYPCFYARDYTCSTSMAGGSSGFSFTTTMEATVGLPAILSPNDTVMCTVYGRLNDLTAGGPTFGAGDLTLLSITNPVMIIYDILKHRLNLPESRINLTQFATVYTNTATEALGFAVPQDRSGSFPTYKNLILGILQSSLFRIFIDNDLKWTLEQLMPLGAVDQTITATDDIIDNTFEYEFDYQDIVSDVIVEYARRERSSDPANATFSVTSTTASSDFARYHHKVEKSKTFQSYHFRSADADTLAAHLSYALGDRKGTISFNTKNKFFDSLLNDNVTITREQLPGFEYVSGTDRTVNAAIVKTSKSLKRVKVELEDQRGIEENSGSW